MSIQAFDDIRLPTDLASGAQGGPGYNTRVVVSGSGYEYRNAQWQYGLAKYTIGQGLKTKAQIAQAIAFFRARQGKARGFRFKDWADYQAVNMPIQLNPRGNRQLTVVYGDAVHPVTRWITKPVQGTVSFSRGGIVLDYATGLCTGPAQVGDTWTGEFDVPVRFDTDQMDFTTHFMDTFEWVTIPLVEIRIQV